MNISTNWFNVFLEKDYKVVRPGLWIYIILLSKLSETKLYPQ